jgi:hypothetical protein
MKKLLLLFSLVIAFTALNYAQDPVNGAFTGKVISKESRKPLPHAKVKITNKDTGVSVEIETDSKGGFLKSGLVPGEYKITVTAKGYQSAELVQFLMATRTNVVLPIYLSKKRKKARVDFLGGYFRLRKILIFTADDIPSENQGTYIFYPHQRLAYKSKEGGLSAFSLFQRRMINLSPS